ncbi:Aminomethyltransferase [Blastocystis hominis]|nr:Aminomethyltransferase [Blastocystis hominis]CBK25284.2 Aminomethyltransferase [Blastocystis hominis]|eukprot:XP_012899332.1 Aminomethyltransferase [Blastocystis hominis]
MLATVAKTFTRPAIRAFSVSANIAHTPLFDLHNELKGKIVEFAGYALPVQYSGVLPEHMAVRGKNTCGLFDVSHMGQIKWTGKDRVEFLERVLVSDIHSLQPTQGRLTLLCQEDGGIIDDTVITNAGDYHYEVVNGACKYGDMEHFKKEMAKFQAEGKEVQMEYLGDIGLIALQGAMAPAVLRRFTEFDVTKMPFMTGQDIKVGGVNCRVTRCGYTGEDGYEVQIPAADSIPLVKEILKEKEVLPCGLGARDSLRLEAGLCLYGTDLSTAVSPVEGTLMWTISKQRRADGGFIGHKAIMERMKTCEKKRVGFMVQGAPARHGAKIYSNGELVGEITSGTLSPSLKKPVAMGYIKKGLHTAGTQVEVEVRNKKYPAVVTKMPFVPNNYYRG